MYTLPTLNTLLPSTPTPTTHTHTLSLHDALPIYRARTGLHEHPPRGRDQPRDAEDAERAPRGDAGTSGDPRRHDIPARGPVLGAGHAESRRAGGRLLAAGSAARSILDDASRRLSVAGRGSED